MGTSEAREMPGAEDGMEAQHWSQSWGAVPKREVTDEELDGATLLRLVRWRGRGKRLGAGAMGGAQERSSVQGARGELLVLAAKAAVSRRGERPRARGARAMRRGAGAVLVRVAAQGGERGREQGTERRGGER